MKLKSLTGNTFATIYVYNDDDKLIAKVIGDCKVYCQDDLEPTESALVRLLTDLEDGLVTAAMHGIEDADENIVRASVTCEMKRVFPYIQSIMRKLKRGSTIKRETALNGIRKELNLR